MYDKIEIALIFTECHTEDEIKRVCVVLRDLMKECNDELYDFVRMVSIKRLSKIL